MLPTDTFLGKLSITEVYEYYNMPVLFACQNKAGQLFLATWIDESEQFDEWLYTPLSKTRFAQLHSGHIDLHDAFTQPEDGFVVKVSVSKASNASAQVDCVLQSDINLKWAPVPGDYLNVPQELPPILWENLNQFAT